MAVAAAFYLCMGGNDGSILDFLIWSSGYTLCYEQNALEGVSVA